MPRRTARFGGVTLTPSAPRAERDRAAAKDAALGDIDWTVPPPGSVASRFTAPSGELAVVSLGDPAHPRVVLVPGATGSKEDFVLMMPVLAGAGFFVQSFDLAGQYESADAGPPRGERFTYELFEQDLVAFLEAGAPAHLLGYSFAGILAQRIATTRTDLVLSLALLTTPAGCGNVFRTMRIIGPLAPLATPRVGAGLMLWGIRTNKNRVPPRRLAFVRSRFALTDRGSVDDMIGLMMRAPDQRDAVRTLTIPKLVATGTHDLWPVAAHERYAQEISAEFRCYSTGHSPCETAPHQLSLDLVDLYRRA